MATKQDRTLPPTVEDLGLLTRWARVAFAVRCALRALSPIKDYWTDSPLGHLIILDRAAEAARVAAELGSEQHLPPNLVQEINGVVAAQRSSASNSRHALATLHTVLSVASAFRTTVYQHIAGPDDASWAFDAGVNSAAARGEQAAYQEAKQNHLDLNAYRVWDDSDPETARRLATETATASMWKDFDRLLDQATAEQWTDNTPVPASFFALPLSSEEPIHSVEDSQTAAIAIPDERDIAQLPRLARVALVARATRRLTNWIRSHPSGPIDPYRLALDAHHSRVEEAAITGLLMDFATPNLDDAVHAIGEMYRSFHGTRSEQANALETIAAVAACIRAAVQATKTQSASDTLAVLVRAVDAMKTRHALSLSPTAPAALAAEISNDIRMLRRLADTQHWNDRSRIPEWVVYQSLWANEAPDGWPGAAAERKAFPGEPDLASLPRWYRIAFWARCARRIQPLFKALRPESTPDEEATIERAVSITEEAAKTAHEPQDAEQAAAAIRNLVQDATNAFKSPSAPEVRAITVAHVAEAAVLSTQSSGKSIAFGGDAVAIAAASPGDQKTKDGLLAAMRHDFERLYSLATSSTDDAVPASFFDEPLWPYGEPERWPGSQPDALEMKPISIYFDANEFTPQDVAGFIKRLSALYQSIGGDELVIEDIELLDPALVLEPVGPVGGDA